MKPSAPLVRDRPPASGGSHNHATEPRTLEEALQRIAILEEQVHRDVLLPELRNKASWHEDLDKRIANGKTFGIFVCDINNFKLVNDTFGHEAGDRLLKDFGLLFKDSFRRDADELAFFEGRDENSILRSRIGGDEFAITIDLNEDEGSRRSQDIHGQMDDALSYLEELGSGFIKTKPAMSDLGLGLAIGPAIWDPAHPLTAAELYSQADEAMYEYKEHDKEGGDERHVRSMGTAALTR